MEATCKCNQDKEVRSHGNHASHSHGAGCSDAGSCCGHDHGGKNRYLNFILPAISFILLILGVIFGKTDMAWFSLPAVKFAWYAIAFLPVGWPVMKEAAEAAWRKDFFNEFSLMSIAAIGAFFIGEYPEAVAVMLFYTVGETLQHKAVDRASQNIGRLLDVRPERTDVFRNGEYVSVPPKDVKVGELIEVKPGGRVPLDGVLMDDGSEFDTSALTGESIPRAVEKGGEVLAGMIVYGRPVRIEVSRPYEQSALARILALVKDAAGRKAPAELFIRRFARVYTPVVTLLALFIVVVPFFVGLFSPSFTYIFSDWLYRGLVFLVISCPCALVISVPLGYFGGIGAASRAGILFKGGNYLDAITRVNTIAFDKTGTLTTGSFEVTDVKPCGIPATELLTVLSAVEQKSTHPVARAIVSFAEKQNVPVAEALEMREIAGHGVEAVVNGKKVMAGKVRLLTDMGVAIPEELTKTVSTVVVCIIDGKFAGYLLLADRLKDDAEEAVEKLKKLNIKDITLLSGDKQEIVDNVAQRLGIEHAYGNLLPEDKAAYIEKLTTEPGRTVAFVGDGMNDAPVLALSDIGIAMGGLGSDAAIESADVVIQNDEPSKVATAVSIGRATRRIVIQNIVGALGVKGVVLVLGALGYATLWAAVFADVGVALLAVLNSVRILGRKF